MVYELVRFRVIGHQQRLVKSLADSGGGGGVFKAMSIVPHKDPKWPGCPLPPKKTRVSRNLFTALGIFLHLRMFLQVTSLAILGISKIPNFIFHNSKIYPKLNGFPYRRSI